MLSTYRMNAMNEDDCETRLNNLIREASIHDTSPLAYMPMPTTPMNAIGNPYLKTSLAFILHDNTAKDSIEIQHGNAHK